MSEENLSISASSMFSRASRLKRRFSKRSKLYTNLLPPWNSDLEFLIPGDLDTYIDLDIKLY